MKGKCLILFCIDLLLFVILIALNVHNFVVEQSRIQTSIELSDAGNVNNSKKIALTFDDGPHPIYTPQLLKGLKERNVKVTFFVIGKNAQLYPDIIKQINDEGHLIGNHTYSHAQLNRLSSEKRCEEINMTNEVVHSITGEYPEFIRPSFGEWDKNLQCDLIPVFWTVDTLDWTTENVNKIVKNGTKRIKDGDIILMHDYYKSSVEAALKIIDELQSEGFEFVTVDDMIL
ncbi:polysaccharide deacetylase family protein [Candidatus Galacturonibacter soehngenii]|uniref:Polysaccharide deacetylase family protein n=1 Tax=Candidatus Galacturonatibacter soehngenii TaxID=2307010 RepID=A0A7V7QNY4_9FIRM|nr:polysaccharide deacetylase family protein [Candidatus Galacturonibacter soehngenii]KAB1440992.1 polysaccharide deacetylase family protein [Candidatus Galacturonibacter soehngenii]MBA4688951.1 polysaccharide deacetylase family protein [Candidatus Galacturonibacter soehngenii]